MGNIIGEGFPSEIIEQVKTRQKIYGEKNRDNETLSFLNSQTGWVRLGSSVNVEVDSRELGLLGSSLAKEYVLFNGTSKFGVTDKNYHLQRSGIKSKKLGIHGNFAYGIGGTEMGLSPMPGITAMSTKTETRGSLKTSTIQIKCHNRVQFDIIDTLYLRLGFTMLLEWGHSSYFNNEGEYVENNPYSLMNRFLGIGKKIEYQEYYPQIEDRRLLSNGNYDALLGKVVNFNWTFNKDGSYNVTLILRSMGDVVESLRTNLLLPDKYKTGLNAALKQLEKAQEALDERKIHNSPYAVIDEQGNYSIDMTSPYQQLLQQQDNNTLPAYQKQIDAQMFAADVGDAAKVIAEETEGTDEYEEKQKEVNESGTSSVYANKDSTSLGRWVYEQIEKFSTIVPTVSGLSNLQTTGGESSWLRQKYSNDMPPHYFVRFKNLLDWIQIKVVPQVKTTPLFLIDTNLETNIIALAGRQVPTDNAICQVAYIQEFEGGQKLYYLGGDDDVSGENFIIEKGKNKYGKIMNIYFNVNFVLEALDKNSIKGKVALIDFLKYLCNGWNDTTGNYSKLEPTFSEETNSLRFIDENQLPDRDTFLKDSKLYNPPKSTELTYFNIYGYYPQTDGNSTAGFVSDFSFETSITPNLATMITIGANSNGQIAGVDATGVSGMNSGYKDRIKPIITSPGISNEEADKASEDALETDYDETLENFTSFLSETGYLYKSKEFPKYNPEIITPFKTCIQTLIEFDQSKKTQNQNLKEKEEKEEKVDPLKKYATASTGFLPFNLSLTMDGLSGMKVYQKFATDTSFLPSNYPNSLEFLISGVENSIVGNKWQTKIESIAVPKNPFSPKSDTKPKYVEGRKRNNNNNANYDNSSKGTTQDYGDTNVTITSGFPLKPTAYQAKEFEKSQIFLHYSAGWQLTDKGLQTIQFLNNRDQTKAGGDKLGLSYHYIIDGAGHNEQTMNNKYRAFHAGNANPPSIGISLQNIGFKSSSNTNADGTLKQPNQSPMVKLVGFDGNPSPYRDHEYGQEITDAQYNTLLALFIKLQSEHSSIPKFIFNQENWNRLFPKKGTTSWNRSTPGWYTHNSSDTGKSDMLPTPKIHKLYLNLAVSSPFNWFDPNNPI